MAVRALRPEYPECLEGLEVGLDSRPATGITASDRESDGWGLVHHLPARVERVRDGVRPSRAGGLRTGNIPGHRRMRRRSDSPGSESGCRVDGADRNHAALVGGPTC